MAPCRWPNISGDYPEDVAEHANCLKADLDLLRKTADISLSHSVLLPSRLQDKILTGIGKGIAEARSNGYCPKWSDIDESIFRKVLLKYITVEAAFKAQDRIPLYNFDGLHKSYNALHTKLIAQIPPTTATTHKSVGADAATLATYASGVVQPSQKAYPATELVQAFDETMTRQRKERAKGANTEESEDDSSAGEESAEGVSDEGESEKEVRTGEDADNAQGVTDSEDSGSCSGSSEEDSDDDNSGTEEDSGTQSGASSNKAENQGIHRDESVRNIIKDSSGFPTTVNLKIKHQASVNRLEGMDAIDLQDCVHRSLKPFLEQQKPCCAEVSGMSVTKLRDNGDVTVVVHAPTREALQLFIDLKGWDQDFEDTLIDWPVPTYEVIMHGVEINSSQFRNRTEKSRIIRELAGENYEICHGAKPIIREDAGEKYEICHGAKPIIRDIRWFNHALPRATAALIVEFQDPEQANHALMHGLRWQGKPHSCERADKKIIDRCTRCQGYGHLRKDCSAPHRCGKCAGHHDTRDCKSETVKCASCGVGQYASHRRCPVKLAARRSLMFPKESTSQVITPAGEAETTPSSAVRQSVSAKKTQTEASMPSPVSQGAASAEDEAESEQEQSPPQADSHQDTQPDLATMLQALEDLKKQVTAALQTKVSGGTKRRAGQAFPGGAQAESSSNVATKRIKKEEPTREDSMGLYHQPSPFIVNRPE